MSDVERLDARTTDGAPVPNALWQADDPSQRLGLILPGEAYSADMPLLYYARRQLLAHGRDVALVRRVYGDDPHYSAIADDGQLRYALDDARAVFRAGNATGRYTSLTVVAKSLGTLVLARFLNSEDCPDGVTCVWLTPLLGMSGVEDTIARRAARSLVIIGSVDGRYDPEAAARIRAAGARVMVVPGADHALEVSNLIHSISILQDVETAIGLFLDAGG